MIKIIKKIKHLVEKNSILFFLLFFLILNLACFRNSNNTKNEIISFLDTICDGKVRFLTLTGSPYERGFQHGKLLKNDILELMGIWKESLEKAYGMPADDFISKFDSLTAYENYIKEYAPDLLEEVQGIADGSGLDFTTVFVFQLVDEVWCNGHKLSTHKCTSFGINRTADSPVLTAQNLDIPKFYHDYITLLKIYEEKKIVSFVLTCPGLIALTGMNNSMVSINPNTLIMLDYDTTGMPVAFNIRKVLQQGSFAEATTFIKTIKHASGQNYIIGGEDKCVSIECSTNEVFEFRPAENSLWTYHTNHPLVNFDFSLSYTNWLKNNGHDPENGYVEYYHCYRFDAMQNRFNQIKASISVEDIKSALASEDFEGERNIANESTFSSVIYVLDKTKPFLLLSPGNPRDIPFYTIDY